MLIYPYSGVECERASKVRRLRESGVFLSICMRQYRAFWRSLWYCGRVRQDRQAAMKIVTGLGISNR